MSFSAKVKEEAFVACGRCCCICHKFCGLKMEVHHIEQRADEGSDTFENAIPLCFDCHADMGGVNPHHPKGNSYTPSELIRHRDAWYEKKRNAITVTVFEDDKETFEKICSVFNPLRASLIENDLYEGVHQNKFMDLYKMIDKTEDPFDEFIEPDLESLRGTLFSVTSTV